MTFIDRTISTDSALNVFGLASLPSENELRKLRRKLIFDNHPDKCTDAAVDLGQIDKAYKILLCMCQSNIKVDISGTKPNRPQSRARIEDVAHEVGQRCWDLLQSIHAQRSEGKRCWRSFDDALEIKDHVPSQVKRCGRDISYLISTPLKEGKNHIAVPTGELVDKRKQKLEVIKIKSKKQGVGTYEVPQAKLARLFPGARSVQLQFNAV